LVDQPKKAFDFEKDDKDLSGSEEDVADGKYLLLGINNVLESIYFELATLKTELRPGVVAHAFNPSTQETEAGRFLSSRPAWSTK
jgi:hypothetical protein